MKGTWIAAALFLVASGPAAHAASLDATTKDGRKVVLAEDGTWSFKEADAATELAATLKKPASATKVVKSKKGFFEMWYDPKKWSAAPGADGAPTEFVLTRKDGDAYAMAIVERISVPMEAFHDIALNNAKGQAPDARIVMEEKRVVNGSPVLAMQIEGTIQSIPFKYYGYYWSGKSGTVQFLTYTAQNLFDEALPDFSELLNGFVVTKD